MRESEHLLVIGSEPQFENFLPPIGGLFASAEFVFADPSKIETMPSTSASVRTLTILVNPDDYPLDLVNSLSGAVWLWFLRRLALVERNEYLESPRLFNEAREGIQRRADYLKQLDSQRDRKVVVSDEASYEFCADLGVNVRLSPPPVNDELSKTQSPTGEVFLAAWNSRTAFSLGILSAMPEEWFRSVDRSFVTMEEMSGINQSIILQDSVVSEFPYEFALCLTAGHLVISQAIEPSWGLEAGIDYLEITTPDELFYVVEALRRNPFSANLMRTRGMDKGKIFFASRVIPKLISAFESPHVGPNRWRS